MTNSDFDAQAAALYAEYKEDQRDWVTDEDAEAAAQIAWEDEQRNEQAGLEQWQLEREQAAAEWEAEARMAQYDDDPNPYDGTYSEM